MENLNYKKARMGMAINTKFAGTKEQKDFIKSLFLSAETPKDERKDTFIKALNKYFGALNIATDGNETMPESVIKYAGFASMPSEPAVLRMFETQLDELQIDTNWMPFYDMTSTPGVQSAEIIDLDSSQLAWANYAPGADLQTSSLGEKSLTQIKEARWGVMVAFLRRWIETDQWWNVNRLMQAIMVANTKKKATHAYTKIGTLATAATPQSCAGTSLDNRVEALNDAYVALLQQMTAQGFDMSASTPARILSRLEHAPIINQMLRRASGADTNNTVVEYPITASYTLNTNITTQFGSKDGFILYIPGKKNIWNTFEGITTKIESDFGTDSMKLGAQEYWNTNEFASSLVTVQLSN